MFNNPLRPSLFTTENSAQERRDSAGHLACDILSIASNFVSSHCETDLIQYGSLVF